MNRSSGQPLFDWSFAIAGGVLLKRGAANSAGSQRGTMLPFLVQPSSSGTDAHAAAAGIGACQLVILCQGTSVLLAFPSSRYSV